MKKLFFSFGILFFMSCGSSTDQDKKIDSMYPDAISPKNDSQKTQVDSDENDEQEIQNLKTKLSKEDSTRIADSVSAKSDPIRDFK